MKAWEVIGYTYEADYHCVDCAEKRFGPGVDNLGKEPKYDNEGNMVHPIFASDEFEETESCGDCGATIRD